MGAALSLPGDIYSDLLREHADLMSVQMAYGETAALIERLLGLSLSTSALTRLVERDAEEVVAFYDDSPPPALQADAPIAEAPILVAEADGKGVPMRAAPGKQRDRKQEDRRPVRLGKGQKRTKKKGAVVTSLYTSERRVRTSEEVLDSFFIHQHGSGPPEFDPGARIGQIAVRCAHGAVQVPGSRPSPSQSSSSKAENGK